MGLCGSRLAGVRFAEIFRYGTIQYHTGITYYLNECSTSRQLHELADLVKQIRWIYRLTCDIDSVPFAILPGGYWYLQAWDLDPVARLPPRLSKVAHYTQRQRLNMTPDALALQSKCHGSLVEHLVARNAVFWRQWGTYWVPASQFLTDIASTTIPINAAYVLCNAS
eukprot:scaffold40361_cov221-Amphora_coffeaeformis.AAC.6